jgi:uroporphyrin-III C-methyltransferase/precorrin-2 dehydrogenase/sirohydrochlorin ferrochelatase
MLLRAHGAVTVVAPTLDDELAALVRQQRLQHTPREFRHEDVDGRVLVIAATDDEAVNAQVAMTARQQRIPVNVVDRPELCTFTVPSIIDRSPVLVAVSTGGASPVLARLLRARLETYIPASFGRLAALLKNYRDQVKRKFGTVKERRRFWEHVLQGPVAEMVFSGRDAAAEKSLQAALDDADSVVADHGEVYLVGAGPGDPDLVTFRALRLMQQADVVLYDRLVAPGILDLVRRDAERIYVGKHRNVHTMRQEDINQTLLTLARQGKRVLRLKGGDPFIFGRGGEEIATLAAEGIQFQVVPGITAASGCACYAGIPLTHRDYAQAVVFVTGQLKDGSVDLNWDALVQPQQTVVVYMGLQGLKQLCDGLVRQGMDSSMPAAVVEQGTTPQQRVVTGTLETLPKRALSSGVRAPTLVIIGEVVRLHDTLAWYQTGLDENS